MATPDPDDFLEIAGYSRPEWARRARCRGMNTNMFFVERGEHVPLEVVNACDNCEVRRQCIDYAAENRLLGYWGSTERSRRLMRRQTRREPAA